MLATITDKKIGVALPSSSLIDYYEPDIVSAQDFYPFGMLMPKRSYSAAGSYRYGFNGKENDNDVKGLGNQQDYGMRIYDARVGRFLSFDPLGKGYPWYTPYQFAGNKPIWAIDLDGLEEIYYTYILDEEGYRTKIAVEKLEIKPEPDRNVVGEFFHNIKVNLKNWWNSTGGQDVRTAASFTDIGDAYMIAFDEQIDGSEASLLDKALVIVPVVGSKVAKKALQKAEYLKYLRSNGYSAKVASAIVNRDYLRGALRIAKGVAKQAHHIVPVKLLKENKVVQDAVEAGFDFNGAVNGIPFPTSLHGSHPNYSDYVTEQIELWKSKNKNYKPKDARKFIQNELIPELEKELKKAESSGQTLNDYFKKQE